MKLLKNAAILTFLGLGVATPAVHAQQITWNAGDVFLGFSYKNSSGSNDLLIDIGPISAYTTPGVAVNVTNVLTDMTNSGNGTGFGSTWMSAGNDRWGVIGDSLGSDPTNTMYAGHPETVLGTPNLNPGSTYNPTFSVDQGGDVTTEQGMAGGFLSDIPGSASSTTPKNAANSSDSVIEAASGSESWFTNAVGTNPSFGAYSGFLGTLSSGGAGDALNFFRIVPSDEGGSSPQLLGTFQIASTGQVTYTAVPEPSTLAALVGGVGVLAFFRRRRTVIA